jgi:hypothetical protein
MIENPKGETRNPKGEPRMNTNKHECEGPLNFMNTGLEEVLVMLREVAQENVELEEVAGGSLAEALAEWVAAQYLFFVRKQLATLTDAAECLKLLQRTARDLAPLQRASRWAGKLKLEEEKLELEREQHKEAMAKAEAKRQAEAQDYGPLTMAEQRAIVDKVDDVLGLKTTPCMGPVPPSPKSEAGKSEVPSGDNCSSDKTEGKGLGRDGQDGQDGRGGRGEICQPAPVEKNQPVETQKVEGVPEWAQTYGF